MGIWGKTTMEPLKGPLGRFSMCTPCKGRATKVESIKLKSQISSAGLDTNFREETQEIRWKSRIGPRKQASFICAHFCPINARRLKLEYGITRMEIKSRHHNHTACACLTRPRSRDLIESLSVGSENEQGQTKKRYSPPHTNINIRNLT